MKTKKLWMTIIAAVLMVAFIVSCKKDEDMGTIGLCPLVISTNPANLATDVPLDQVITATFNEEIDPQTVTEESFTIHGQNKVSGTISYDDESATIRFAPASDLVANTTYTGRITTAVKDPQGNALQTDYVWTFSTGTTVAPAVISTDPADNETNVVLNKVITATFSVPMDSMTLNIATFTLKQGATPIAGTVSYNGTTAYFHPVNLLSPGLVYTATITAGATNEAGTPLPADYVWSFSTGSLVAPVVISTDPVNNAVSVPLNKRISATFSVPMDPLTMTSATFLLKQGTTPITGSVSYSGTTVTFTPAANLSPGVLYTATITTGAKDVSGTALANDYIWTFTTEMGTPLVITTDPANNATNVVLNKQITATFNMPMDPATITPATFTLKQGTTTIAGTVTYSGTTATFSPVSNLLSGTTYTATITTGAKNTDGTAMASNHVWTFSTGVALAPTVISTDPVNNATNVPLNKIITATFSIPMDPATITQATYTLKQGNTTIAGTVTYSGTTATFTPLTNLVSGLVYTATITTGAKNVAGTPMANNYVWSFTTVPAPAPLVISTDPANNATNVPVNKVITATFNMAMNSATLPQAFTVKQGSTTVPGTVTYAGNTASFTPTGNLAPGTVYTATISTAARSAAGTAMASNYVWSFTTATAPVPMVISTDPASSATNVPVNKVISATFNMQMNAATLPGAFTLKQGTTTIPGTVTYTNNTAYFTPTGNLAAGTVYTATISTAARNTAGTAMASNYVWNFTTVAPSAPLVIATDPVNNATNVALDKVISATFNMPMNAATMPQAFTVKQGSATVAGTVTYSGNTAYFTPAANLLSGSVYTATISTAARSAAGTAMVNNHVWTFTTRAPAGAPFIDLKTAARFGILAGTGISNNAGFSQIRDMDVGISPGVRSSITGFPPATIVNGAIYASDDVSPPGVAAMLIQAKQHLTEAYQAAEGATSPAPAIVAGDQGGKTLAPGIYKSNSTLSIQNGDLTLDAQGDVNAVWIFQIASGFTTVGGAGGNVILTGGAQAKNIFWQVGSSAVIGDFTSFKGNVLALTSITMNSGATAEGRMLARNGAVVMTNTNFINKP